MASGAHPGAKILLYAVAPNKDKKALFQGVNEQTGPGGSADGVQATVKDNELPFMPLITSWVLRGGDKLVLYGILVTADGSDASDSVFNVPIRRNGSLEYLSASDFGYTSDMPAGSLAGVEHQLGQGYTVPQNDVIQLGGGKYFMSWQNDTA